ncbi:MAG: hypothetical protein SVZ03_02805 [Spirochaetota bacterium]|nr:hypothetical protein [Spirochaetota bacterium]
MKRGRFVLHYLALGAIWMCAGNYLGCSCSDSSSDPAFFPPSVVDTIAPTPGSAVSFSAFGAAIRVSWGEVSDDSGSDGLTNKLVRSSSEISIIEEGECVDTVQDYASYSGVPVEETIFIAGTYFYNVLVKDAAGNRAIYTGDSCAIVDLIYVNIDNVSGIEDGTRDHPFNTIQEGVDAATEGMVVIRVIFSRGIDMSMRLSLLIRAALAVILEPRIGTCMGIIALLL